MAGRLTRRSLLGATAGVTVLAGCSDHTPSECEEGVAYTYRAETFQVEPLESGWGSDDEPTDADPDLVDDLQRQVPTGVRVSIDREFSDEDDYVFAGPITRKEALRACDRVGFEANDTDWSRAITNDLIAALEDRVETLRANGFPLDFLELTTIEDFNYLLYDEDTSETTRTDWNRRLGRMGGIDVSVGAPKPGNWRPIHPDRSAIRHDGTTVTIPLAGEAVRSLLKYNQVPSNPSDEPLRVYVDGEHVATRTLSSADFGDGSALLDPETTVDFDSQERAASMYAALAHPTKSVVNFVTQCD